MQALREKNDEQLLHGDESPHSYWSPSPMTPRSQQIHDHKKSVLTKVKDKAKKWTHTLRKKKQGHDDEGNSTASTPTSTPTSTPRSGVSLFEEEDSMEKDPEYFGASSKKSLSLSPHTECNIHNNDKILHNKEALLSPRTPKSPVLDHGPPTSETEPKLHRLNSLKEISTHKNITSFQDSDKLTTQTEAKPESGSTIISETVTEMLTPAYNIVSDATSKIAAKISSPRGSRDEIGAKMTWDKGISVKEYLWHKLEPGEEEKALSEVITEAISPRKGDQEKSVVEKVRGVVSSLLGKEQESSSDIPADQTLSQLLVKEDQKGRNKTVHIASDPVIHTERHGPSTPRNSDEMTVSEKMKSAMSLILGKEENTSPTKSVGSVTSPVSQCTRGNSRPLFKGLYGDSILLPKGSSPSSNHAQGTWNLAESRRTNTNTNPFSENINRASKKASPHASDDKMPLSICVPETSISPSKHAHEESRRVHGSSIRNVYKDPLRSVNSYEDTAPLPLSTQPSVYHTSMNLPTVSTKQLSANSHAEVEESNGRVLQAYTN